VAGNVKQCSILLVNDDGGCSQRAALEGSGFRVTEIREWPDDHAAILDHHVVIVRIRSLRHAPMIAARLRAKPRFGRRVLIALVPQAASLDERTAALTSGFDDVLNDSCDARHLISRILKRLRMVPEYHCLLPRRVA
jgi:DNA-binding response OmpR family regulator